jgi:hypothetical protein
LVVKWALATGYPQYRAAKSTTYKTAIARGAAATPRSFGSITLMGSSLQLKGTFKNAKQTTITS